jgi:hypothetical protein
LAAKGTKAVVAPIVKALAAPIIETVKFAAKPLIATAKKAAALKRYGLTSATTEG